MTKTTRPYNKEDSYFFLDYRMFTDGDPERCENLIKEGKYPEGFNGIPRWVRNDFLTNYELMNHLNYIINEPYPHRYEGIRIQSDEELSKIISVGVKKSDDGEKEYYRIWKSEDGFDDGEKMTLREFKFGKSYEEMSKYYKSGKHPVSVKG